MTVALSPLCDEPNPLGDEILFFSSDARRSHNKLSELNRKKNTVVNESNSSTYSSTSKSEEGDIVNFGEVNDLMSESVEESIGVARQRQKYFATYSAEAEQLALECADALRMQSQIGDVILFYCYIFSN